MNVTDRFAHYGLCLLVTLSAACDDGAKSSPSDAANTDEVSEVADDLGTDASEVEGCGDGVCADTETSETCAVDCVKALTFVWEPFGDDLTAIPDDFLTVADAALPNGQRLDITLARYPALSRFPTGFREIFDMLSTLDGFGTSAPLWLQFDGFLDQAMIPAPMATIEPGSSIVVGWLEGETFHVVPVRVSRADNRRGLMMRPMVALPAGVRGVALVKRTVLGLQGERTQPNEALSRLLAGNAEGDFAPLQSRYDEALNALIAAGHLGSRDDVAAMTVFTTQSLIEHSRALAARVMAETYPLVLESCSTSGALKSCPFHFESPDLRSDDGHVNVGDSGPLAARLELQGVVYLPEPSPTAGPLPIMLFGHGLGGDRTQARQATQLLRSGWAVVSIDAPSHGLHPQNGGIEPLEIFFHFFGLGVSDVNGLSFDPLAMAGSLYQGTADKLALVEAIGDGLDLDDDGSDDITSEHMSYFGVSLGGIMAPQFLALTDKVEAAVLVAGGGRIIDVVADSDFSEAVKLLLPASLSGTDGELVFLLGQTVVDQSDGASFAHFVTQDRLDGRPGIQMLSAISLGDTVVPNNNSLILARGFGGAHVLPNLLDAGTLPVVKAPLSGNMPDGNTSGFLEIDWTNETGLLGGWELTDHQSIAPCRVGMAAWTHFLDSFRDTGTGEIIDPWATLSLDPPR